MNILDITDQLRKSVNEFGNMVLLADKSGVTYSWLTKFADGRIRNPTVSNLHKLEHFFQNLKKDAA